MIWYNKRKNRKEVSVMKKFLALVLAAMMLVSCVAFAESILDADLEKVMTFCP